MAGGNRVKRLIGVGPGWALGKAQDAPFLRRGLDLGLQPAQTTPLLGWQDWGSGSPRCCPEEDSPTSRLHTPGWLLPEAGPVKDLGLSRKARSRARWEGLGLGLGLRRDREGGGEEQVQTATCSSRSPRGQESAYVCTWVSWTSPATSRLLMAGRFFRRW